MGNNDVEKLRHKTNSIPLYLNEDIWVYWKFLEDFELPDNTLKAGTKRFREKGGLSWINKSYNKDSRKNIIQYRSIPKRTVEKYNLPPVDVLIKYTQTIEKERKAAAERERKIHKERELIAAKQYDQNKLEDLHSDFCRIEDMDFYRENSKLSNDKTYEMARAYAMLRLLCSYQSKLEIKATFQRVTSNKALRELATEMIKKEIQHSKVAFYGLRITNPLRLYFKMQIYDQLTNEDERRRLLISGKEGNNNARKGTIVNSLGLDNHQIMWIGIWSNFGKSAKFTKKRTYEIYQNLCESRGMRSLAIRTMGAFLNRLDIKILTSYERDGKKEFNDKYLPYVSAMRSKYSLSVVSMDGGVIGLYYQKPDANGRNIIRKRLTIVFLADHHSGAIIGYDIGESETGDMARKALKMMFKLSNYHRAKEVILDNGSAFCNHLTEQSLKVCFQKTSHIAKGNSQQNPAEGMVRILEHRFSHYEGWSGENITSKGMLRPNPDYFPKPSELMTKEEVIREVLDVIDTYNNEVIPLDGRTRWQAFQEDINPECEQVDELNAQFITKLRSIPIKMKRGEVRLKVDNMERLYIVDDWYKAAKQLSPANKGKVVLYYDDDCPEYVEAYNYTDKKDPAGDSFLFIMNEKDFTAKGFAEQTEDTKKALGKAKQRKETVIKTVTETMGGIKELLDQEFDEGELTVPFTTGKQQHKADFNDAEDRALSKYYHEHTTERIPQAVTTQEEAKTIDQLQREMINKKFEDLMRDQDEDNDGF